MELVAGEPLSDAAARPARRSTPSGVARPARARPPTRSAPPTRPASCTATSSRPTCSSPPTARSRSPTSASPAPPSGSGAHPDRPGDRHARLPLPGAGRGRAATAASDVYSLGVSPTSAWPGAALRRRQPGRHRAGPPARARCPSCRPPCRPTSPSRRAPCAGQGSRGPPADARASPTALRDPARSWPVSRCPAPRSGQPTPPPGRSPPPSAGGGPSPRSVAARASCGSDPAAYGTAPRPFGPRGWPCRLVGARAWAPLALAVEVLGTSSRPTASPPDPGAEPLARRSSATPTQTPDRGRD